MSRSPENWEAFFDDVENNITKSTHAIIYQSLGFADLHSLFASIEYILRIWSILGYSKKLHHSNKNTIVGTVGPLFSIFFFVFVFLPDFTTQKINLKI